VQAAGENLLHQQGTTFYTAHQIFAMQILANGVSIAYVAELMGTWTLRW
jgi:hypothetical protein